MTAIHTETGISVERERGNKVLLLCIYMAAYQRNGMGWLIA